jgi:hypothetical protein
MTVALVFPDIGKNFSRGGNADLREGFTDDPRCLHFVRCVPVAVKEADGDGFDGLLFHQ